VAEARSDALTGLGNRRAFDEHLARLIARVAVEGGEVSLVLVDLDDFKEINDREGHPAGDRVLRAVAKTLVRAVRANEEVFRVGGDEFAVVVDGGSEAASRIADRIAGMLLGQRRIHPLPTVSAGVATLPATAATADELVRLIPPRPLPLDQALEFIREDECVEVTPLSVRLRKVELSAQKRQTATSRRSRGLAPV